MRSTKKRRSNRRSRTIRDEYEARGHRRSERRSSSPPGRRSKEREKRRRHRKRRRSRRRSRSADREARERRQRDKRRLRPSSRCRSRSPATSADRGSHRRKRRRNRSRSARRSVSADHKRQRRHRENERSVSVDHKRQRRHREQDRSESAEHKRRRRHRKNDRSVSVDHKRQRRFRENDRSVRVDHKRRRRHRENDRSVSADHRRRRRNRDDDQSSSAERSPRRLYQPRVRRSLDDDQHSRSPVRALEDWLRAVAQEAFDDHLRNRRSLDDDQHSRSPAIAAVDRFGTISQDAIVVILQYLTDFERDCVAPTSKQVAAATRVCNSVPGPIVCPPRPYLQKAWILSKRLLRTRLRPTRFLWDQQINVSVSRCTPRRQDVAFAPGWHSYCFHGEQSNAPRLSIFPEHPHVAKYLTHLSIMIYLEDWKFGHDEAFPNLVSLSVEFLAEAHDTRHVRFASAFGWGNLHTLKLSVKRDKSGRFDPVGVDPDGVDMNEEDAALFSNLTKLRSLSLHIGLNVELIGALAAALPRDLTELHLESITGSTWLQKNFWPPVTPTIFELTHEQLSNIGSSLPQDLRSLSLPVKWKRECSQHESKPSQPDPVAALYRRFPLEAGTFDLETLAGDSCPSNAHALRSLALSVDCTSLATISISDGLAKFPKLDALSLAFRSSSRGGLQCTGELVELPPLAVLHTLKINSIAEAPPAPLIESLAHLPSLNTLHLHFEMPIDMTPRHLAKALSRTHLRTLYTDATTLTLQHLEDILYACPRLLYVNIQMRNHQQEAYDQFSAWLAHARKQLREGLFYVVNLEFPCGPKRSRVQRNVNGTERIGY